MHFALVVVVNPWGCLDEETMHKTRILYFDSMSRGTPLAKPAHFARFALECNAMRHGMEASEPMDPAAISAVESRIAFEIVDVSPLFQTCQLLTYTQYGTGATTTHREHFLWALRHSLSPGAL